jgi:hypothetical protein
LELNENGIWYRIKDDRSLEKRERFFYINGRKETYGKYYENRTATTAGIVQAGV